MCRRCSYSWCRVGCAALAGAFAPCTSMSPAELPECTLWPSSNSPLPRVLPVRFKWGLALEVLFEDADSKLFDLLESVQLLGPVNSHSLASAVWPPRLQILAFGLALGLPFNQSIDDLQPEVAGLLAGAIAWAFVQ